MRTFILRGLVFAVVVSLAAGGRASAQSAGQPAASADKNTAAKSDASSAAAAGKNAATAAKSGKSATTAPAKGTTSVGPQKTVKRYYRNRPANDQSIAAWGRTSYNYTGIGFPRMEGGLTAAANRTTWLKPMYPPHRRGRW